MSDLTDEELNAEGLIGESYDAVFSIRTRVRKFNDIEVPIRGGITPSQIGAFLFGLIGSLFSYVLIVKPFFALLTISLHWMIVVSYILGIPILAAQRIIKPMRYGKSISSTATSWWNDITDSPVHARGLPVPARPEEDVPGETLVYQRVWVPSEAVTEEEMTDERAEILLDGYIPDVEEWAKNKAVQHIEESKHHERIAAQNRETVTTTRSRGGSVVMGDEEVAA